MSSLEFEVEAEGMYPLSPKASHEGVRRGSEGKKDVAWTNQLRWDVSRRDERACMTACSINGEMQQRLDCGCMAS